VWKTKKIEEVTRHAMPSSEDSSVDLENVSSGDSLDYGDAAASKETGSGEVKSKAPAPPTHLCGIPMKFVQVFILLLLMAQNVAMYTVARYSQAGGKSTKPYLKTTVVLMQELVKITACFVIISVQSGFGGMVRHHQPPPRGVRSHLSLFALFFLIRYASSILKTFATGSAIVVTGVISAFTPAMDFTPNMMFIGGALIVVGSIFAYGIAGQKKGPTAIVHTSDSK
jgi:hypothetical protein